MVNFLLSLNTFKSLSIRFESRPLKKDQITATNNSFPFVLYYLGLSQNPRKFMTSVIGSAGLTNLPSKINCSYSFVNDDKEIEETQGGSKSRCDDLWGGEKFRDCSQCVCNSGRCGDETQQDSGHVFMSRKCLSLDCSKSPTLRRRQVSRHLCDCELKIV